MPSSSYVDVIDKLMRRFYGKSWRDYASESQIARHEKEGWDAEKFVAFIAMKFNLDPLDA